MTTRPMTDAKHAAEYARRFTPHLVDLTLHGSNVTFTILLDGRYYTAACIYPDFPNVADDAKLVLTDNSLDGELRERPTVALAGFPTRENTCESEMIGFLLDRRELTFGDYFQEYLIYLRLNNAEPAKLDYYLAKKIFMTVWNRLAKIIAGD